MLRINIVLHTLIRPKLSRGKETEADPDDDQGDELHPVQRLVIDEHADEQVQSRADVLGHAEGEHLDLLGRTGEQRQRDHSHQAAEHEEPVLVRLALAEGPAAGELKEEYDHQGDGRERDSYQERDRRQLPVVDQHDDHRSEGEKECRHLVLRQLFVEDQHPEERNGHRLNVISYARLEDVAGVNGPDEHAPVQRDYYAGGQEFPRASEGPHRRKYLLHAVLPQREDQRHQEHQQYPVYDYYPGVYRHQGLPVYWQDAPQDHAQDDLLQAFSVCALVVIHVLPRVSVFFLHIFMNVWSVLTCII